MAKEVKIVTVGDGAVGKTSVLITYSTDKFPTKYVPTVFDNFSTDVMVEAKKVIMELWDTAGQEDYDRLRPVCYQNCDAFIVCYSIVDPISLEHVQTKWIPEINKFAPDVPFVLVGTKMDLREEADECVDLATAQKMATDLGAACEVIECSAKTQNALKHVMIEAARIACTQRKTTNKRACTLL